jgi:hypothetical protein
MVSFLSLLFLSWIGIVSRGVLASSSDHAVLNKYTPLQLVILNNKPVKSCYNVVINYEKPYQNEAEQRFSVCQQLTTLPLRSSDNKKKKEGVDQQHTTTTSARLSLYPTTTTGTNLHQYPVAEITFTVKPSLSSVNILLPEEEEEEAATATTTTHTITSTACVPFFLHTLFKTTTMTSFSSSSSSSSSTHSGAICPVTIYNNNNNNTNSFSSSSLSSSFSYLALLSLIEALALLVMLSSYQQKSRLLKETLAVLATPLVLTSRVKGVRTFYTTATTTTTPTDDDDDDDDDSLFQVAATNQVKPSQNPQKKLVNAFDSVSCADDTLEEEDGDSKVEMAMTGKKSKAQQQQQQQDEKWKREKGRLHRADDEQ